MTETAADIRRMARQNPDTRPFSLGLHLVIVFAFSWPFQLAFICLGESFRPILLVSMIMAGTGCPSLVLPLRTSPMNAHGCQDSRSAEPGMAAYWAR